jgi:AraC-like DNA-binding protein
MAGELRFNRARRELLPAGRKLSVTEVATRCGLSHLGRTAYYRRYGERPSEMPYTLQRGSTWELLGQSYHALSAGCPGQKVPTTGREQVQQAATFKL